MQLIKLSATDSTNAYLRRLDARENVADFTVVQACHQTAGRGQRGNRWVAEKGKNLTFSVLKRIKGLPTSRHFLLNILVSLAVQETLESLEIPGIRVKWPNDILSGGQKIGGILLENQFQGNRISRSIIGIGLNVNQTEFRDLPAASSLNRVMDIEYDLDALLACLLGSLREHLSRLPAASEAELLKAYEASLFQKDEAADYFGIGGVPFRGVIRGVHPDGRLKMEMEGGALEAFGFQELRFSL